MIYFILCSYSKPHTSDALDTWEHFLAETADCDYYRKGKPDEGLLCGSVEEDGKDVKQGKDDKDDKEAKASKDDDNNKEERDSKENSRPSTPLVS